MIVCFFINIVFCITATFHNHQPDTRVETWTRESFRVWPETSSIIWCATLVVLRASSCCKSNSSRAQMRNYLAASTLFARLCCPLVRVAEQLYSHASAQWWRWRRRRRCAMIRPTVVLLVYWAYKIHVYRIERSIASRTKQHQAGNIINIGTGFCTDGRQIMLLRAVAVSCLANLRCAHSKHAHNAQHEHANAEKQPQAILQCVLCLLSRILGPNRRERANCEHIRTITAL